jgi:hypothetical protein
MKRALSGRSIHDLNRDYIAAAALAGELELDPEAADRLGAYRRFIETQGHRIGRFPGSLLPVAHAQPRDSLVRAQAIDLEEKRRGPDRPWFRLLNPPPTDPNRALLRVFEGHAGLVASVAFSPDGRQALSGS